MGPDKAPRPSPHNARGHGNSLTNENARGSSEPTIRGEPSRRARCARNGPKIRESAEPPSPQNGPSSKALTRGHPGAGRRTLPPSSGSSAQAGGVYQRGTKHTRRRDPFRAGPKSAANRPPRDETPPCFKGGIGFSCFPPRAENETRDGADGSASRNVRRGRRRAESPQSRLNRPPRAPLASDGSSPAPLPKSA